VIIHKVESPRIGQVELGTNSSGQKNRISVLTGPNGSGKTEILATIANVFYGAIHIDDDQTIVSWSDRGHVARTTFRNRDEIRRPSVVAQTFSPFSRFPVHIHDDPRFALLLDDSTKEHSQYVPIGFASSFTRNIKELTRSTVEEGLLRLSSEPKVAKAIMSVLRELNFQQGIRLEYQSGQLLQALTSIAGQHNVLEEAFLRSLRSGTLSINGYRPFGISDIKLWSEIRNGDISYVADFIHHAIKLVRPYQSNAVSAAQQHYSFQTLEEHSMSSDYRVLQAFSMLRQLGLMKLNRCLVRPSGSPTIDVTSTSSGQQQLLCTFLGLASALVDNAVVLIDEPELSLHPSWQLKFIAHIENVLSVVSNCHVIIATHSPLITQAAISHGAEIKELAPLVRFERSTNPRTLSVDEALVTIFDTPVPNSLHVANEILELISGAETGHALDLMYALRQINAYLQIYRAGEENLEMVRLLEKAERLIKAAGRGHSERLA
jgi:ABC-type cobalamin/Fe3+-siderophores transport system ATPase subunit